jgi:hypothetical protein
MAAGMQNLSFQPRFKCIYFPVAKENKLLDQAENNKVITFTKRKR